MRSYQAVDDGSCHAIAQSVYAPTPLLVQQASLCTAHLGHMLSVAHSKLDVRGTVWVTISEVEEQLRSVHRRCSPTWCSVVAHSPTHPSHVPTGSVSTLARCCSCSSLCAVALSRQVDRGTAELQLARWVTIHSASVRAEHEHSGTHGLGDDIRGRGNNIAVRKLMCTTSSG